MLDTAATLEPQPLFSEVTDFLKRFEEIALQFLPWTLHPDLEYGNFGLRGTAQRGHGFFKKKYEVCPVTAFVLATTGIFFPIDKYPEAAESSGWINEPLAQAIMNNAEDKIGFLGFHPDLRKQLLRITNVEEPS